MTKYFLIVGLLLLTTAAQAGQLLIAVAANFTGATQALVERFERDTGHRVGVSFGSTGKLYAQIANGAPFELYLAADSARPAKAIEQGLAQSGSRFTYAQGRLVLWSIQPQLFDNGERYLRSAEFAHAGPRGFAPGPFLMALALRPREAGGGAAWDRLPSPIRTLDA